MISDEQRQKALDLVECGVTPDVALRSIGVIGDELSAALEDPSFQAEAEVSTARFEVTALQAIRTGSPSEKRNMSWLLAARFPERYPTPGSRTSSRPSVPAASSPALGTETAEGSTAAERMYAARAKRLRELEAAKLEEGMTAVERMYFRRECRRRELDEAREQNIQRLKSSPAPQSTVAPRRPAGPAGVIGPGE